MSPSLTVIGAGRLGKTLACLFRRNQVVDIADILNRTLTSAEQAVAWIGAGLPIDRFELLRPAGIFLLAVPDDQLASCCERLAQTGLIGSGSLVFHCSGALGSDALKAASATGAMVASVHPVRSFADPGKVIDEFAGTWCGVEGDAPALAVLAPMFERIGAQLIPVKAASKTLYHAAAVFASNYLVSLLAVAQQAYVEAGIPKEVALELLVPLARETAENVARLGPAAALTGPIARGDLATVQRQQSAIDNWDPGYGELYRHLADATMRLAASRNIP